MAGNGQGTLVFWQNPWRPCLLAAESCSWVDPPERAAHPLGSRPHIPAEPTSTARGVRARPTSDLRGCGQLLPAPMVPELDIVEWQLGSCEIVAYLTEIKSLEYDN